MKPIEDEKRFIAKMVSAVYGRYAIHAVLSNAA
jgi:hypothetical protein